MTKIDYRHGIAILELIAFAPSLVISVLLASRHGFRRADGWFFFILFSLLRIVGNGCYMGTLNDPENTGLYTAWAICSSIGISPLLFGLLYNLSRVNDSIQRKTGRAFWPQIFRVFGFITLFAIIVNIVGITSSDSLQDGVKSIETKVAMGLYLASWVGLVGLILMVGSRYSSIESGEHRLLWAVAICTPILVIRLAYSFMGTFGHSTDFNLVYGNVTIQLFMVTIEEIIIVYIMLLTGLTLTIKDKVVYKAAESVEIGETAYDPLNPEMGNLQGNGYSSAPRRKPKRPIRGGPIHMLVAYTRNKIDERNEQK